MDIRDRVGCVGFVSDFIDWLGFMLAFEELIGEVKDEGLGESCVSIGMDDPWGYGDECWDFDHKLMAIILCWGILSWVPELNDPRT